MDLSPADDAAILAQYQAEKNRPGLWGWIADQFKVKLPYRSFAPGHSTPFDFVADAFFNPSRDMAAWANRSGIKTLGASILAALEFTVNDGMEARVLAGSEDQAKNLYKYWSEWCAGPLAWRIEGDVKKLLTRVGSGGTFKILTASPKSVRGDKVQRLYEDELDEIAPELDETAKGMIDSRPGMPGRTVYTSTWHRVDGAMGRMIDRAAARGIKLHRWNVWESIARCDRHENGNGCESCPLGASCVATAQDFHADPEHRVGIAAEATGLYSINDAIQACRNVSAATWESEYLCLRPSVAGLVYPEFDPRIHAIEQPPAHLTIYRAIDWGYNIFVCLWIGEDKDGTAYVLDTYRAETGTIAQHAKHILEHPLQRVAATYCDPAGRNKNDQTGKSNVQLFREQGIECRYTLSPKLRDVRNGIQMVRAMVQTATGDIRLRYVPSTANAAFVRAMQSYHNRKVNDIWLDEPKDPQEHEHIPDALRYYVVNRQTSHGIGVVGLGAA